MTCSPAVNGPGRIFDTVPNFSLMCAIAVFMQDSGVVMNGAVSDINALMPESNFPRVTVLSSQKSDLIPV
jgi:hypothetical protein